MTKTDFLILNDTTEYLRAQLIIINAFYALIIMYVPYTANSCNELLINLCLVLSGFASYKLEDIIFTNFVAT